MPECVWPFLCARLARLGSIQLVGRMVEVIPIADVIQWRNVNEMMTFSHVHKQIMACKSNKHKLQQQINRKSNKTQNARTVRGTDVEAVRGQQTFGRRMQRHNKSNFCMWEWKCTSVHTLCGGWLACTHTHKHTSDRTYNIHSYDDTSAREFSNDMKRLMNVLRKQANTFEY